VCRGNLTVGSNPTLSATRSHAILDIHGMAKIVDTHLFASRVDIHRLWNSGQPSVDGKPASLREIR